MEIKRELELLEKYQKCPECVSVKIGNNEGTLDIDTKQEDEFKIERK